MSDTATAKAQAVDSLDEVAKALKRAQEANKWALQIVRQAQARLVGIEVHAPTAQIRQARASLAGIPTHTDPTQRSGHSDTSKDIPGPRAA